VNQLLLRCYSPGMRPLALWRHEVRRAGRAALLVPPVAALVPVLAAVDGAARLDAASRDTAHLLQAVLELALPLAAGLGAASLVGGDPAIELQLTLPTPYRATILRRLAVTAGWVGLLALALAVTLVATGWWHRWPAAHPAVVGQLTWLAPALFLAGLGLLGGALSGSPAVASALVAVLRIWLTGWSGTGSWACRRCWM
jgi:hypothetical protein